MSRRARTRRDRRDPIPDFDDTPQAARSCGVFFDQLAGDPPHFTWLRNRQHRRTAQ